jgi:DnaJ-class molecular chaperone
MKRSFYQMLDVPLTADQAAIDAAYAKAKERLGADIKRGAATASTEGRLIREGYEILSNPAIRAKYDAKMAAAEKGVELVFFPEGEAAQRELGVQSVVFAVLAATFCGVVYWQMTSKMNAVRVDYETVVARKQATQNAPKVIGAIPLEQENATVVVDAGRSEPLIKGAAEKK